MRICHSTQSKNMAEQLIMLTIAEFYDNFLENFRAWLAGALAAKGVKHNIIKLDEWAKLDSQSQAFTRIQNACVQAKKVLLILPEQDHVLHHSTHCLLYTSPSPRDGATSRMPSSA